MFFNKVSTLYALLVGIDRYPGKPLNGCVNDLLAWESYLEEWAGNAGELSLATLKDEEATRPRILEAFRSHLGRARNGDTALFCFSGHGSQELAPPQYEEQEPGGLSETLVAYDSRIEGGLDIADKELAVLIAEVARGGAHIVVILDSCHSGTATREFEEESRVRRLGNSAWPRPAGSYWFLDDASVPRDLNTAGGWRVLPIGRHVLLAACEDYQKARECTAPDGRKRGLFSYYLLETLEQLSPGTTYRELFKQVQARVRNLVPDQLPQAEGDLARSLFDGAIVPRPARYHVRFQKGGVLRLDAGAVHAMHAGSEVAVLPVGTPEPADLSRKLATARVVEVEAGSSRLELIDGDVPPEPPVHPAVLTRLSLAPVRVAVEEGSGGALLLQQGIERSPYLTLVLGSDEADILVRAEGRSCRLRRPGAAGDLTHFDGFEAEPGEIVGALEHVARWQALAELANPGSPLFDAVEMTVWEVLPPPSPGLEPELRLLPACGEIRLPYRKSAGMDPEPSRFCVHLRNQLSQPLYFALLALDETFGVKVVQGGAGRLPADAEVWLRRGDGIPSSVPDRYHARGATQRRDLLVLLLSAVEADFHLLEQGGLFELGDRHGSRRAPARAWGFLDTLFRRITWRELDERPLLAHQWAAKCQAIVGVRPMPWYQISGRKETAELVPGVRLRVPDGLRGAARLHSTASRPSAPGLEGLSLELRSLLRPVALAGAVGSDPGLSSLELHLAEPALVSEAAPFVVETDLLLSDAEALVAVEWNGDESKLILPGLDEVPPSSCLIASFHPPAAKHEAIWLDFYVMRVGECGA